MSQKLPLSSFMWDKEIYQFNKDFIKICNENSSIGYFIEADVPYLE